MITRPGHAFTAGTFSSSRVFVHRPQIAEQICSFRQPTRCLKLYLDVPDIVTRAASVLIRNRDGVMALERPRTRSR